MLEALIRITDNNIHYSFLEEKKIVVTKNLKNPIPNLSSANVFEYLKDNDKKETDVKLIRETINKTLKAFLKIKEKDSFDMCVIATNGLYSGLITDSHLDFIGKYNYNDFIGPNNCKLQTNNLFFIPCIDNYIGGDFISEMMRYEDNSMIIECGPDFFNILYCLGQDGIVTSMRGLKYDVETKIALHAAINVIRPQGYSPMVYLYGENMDFVKDILIEQKLVFAEEEYNYINMAKTCYNGEFRSNLQLLHKFIKPKKLVEDEMFHEECNFLQHIYLHSSPKF